VAVALVVKGFRRIFDGKLEMECCWNEKWFSAFH